MNARSLLTPFGRLGKNKGMLIAVGLLAGAGLFAACSNGADDEGSNSDAITGPNRMPYITNLNPK